MDDLISEFIAETTESLSVLDQELIRLKQNPDDEAILGNIFRIVHTIKGTCGFLGLPRLETVAHASENVLGKIRDRQLEATEDAISLVLESLDAIKSIIDYISENGGQEPEGDDAQLCAQLNHFAETGEVTDTPTAGSGAEDESDFEASALIDDAGGEEDFSSFFKGEDELKALIDDYESNQHNEDEQIAAEMLEQIEALEALEAGDDIPATAPVAPIAAVKVKPSAAKPAKKEASKEAAAAQSSSATQQSIRVNLDVLENLMQMVGELVLTRNQLLQIVRTREDKDFMAPIQQLSLITTELQEGVMKTRMQPIGNAWSKFPRLVRDLSHDLDKKIELKMVGAETELDRQLLEMIKDPLTHMVRNSCDHGLETPEERAANGKDEVGTLTLSAFHEGGHIIIKIADDGKGINVERVKEKIVANGLASESDLETIGDQQIIDYIFRPGFSTAEKVTSVSGRGVGMDVVRTNIEKIGGNIQVESDYGHGSTFSIKIPLTLAIVSVLLVEANGEKFGIPQINVLELVRVSPSSEYSVEMVNGAPLMRLRDKLLPLGGLGSILQLQREEVDWESRDAFVVVCRVGGYDFGLLVDRVFDTEEIVVKPVSEMLKAISVYSGNTILGDGSVIMILDPNGVAKTIGEVEFGNEQQTSNDEMDVDSARIISFLLFNAGGGSPKAVPLELVSRLEEIEVEKIEISGDSPVVQYRGDIMKLISLNDSISLPDEGLIQVIVFSYDKRTIGLVVDEIQDIVEAEYDLKLTNTNKRFSGSMVIQNKTTEIVDVAHLLSDGNSSSVKPDAKIAVAEGDDRPCLLFVEDSPFFRNLTEPMLTDAGYNVTAVGLASEAIKVLESNKDRFDLIVTDVEMPGMSGLEFTCHVRNELGLNKIPVIAYTSAVSNQLVEDARKAGVTECIVKTDRHGLIKSMERHLVASGKEYAA